MARQAIVVRQVHRAAARQVVAHHELRSEHRSHRAEAHRVAVLQVWVAHRAIAVARQARQARRVHRAIEVVRRRAAATVAVAAAIRAARRVAHIVAARTRAVAHIRAEETLVADSSFTI